MFATVVEGTPPVVREEVIRLRQYQEECIQSVLSYLDQGHKRLGVSLATGSGKTVIFTQLIDRVKPTDDQAKQTLILAHRRELVEQAARHCERAYPGKSIDIEMGDVKASGAADITVASIRSLASWDRLRKYDPKRFKLVLVDEAHHIVAPGYLEVLEYFGLYPAKEECHAKETGPALVGVSATFSRFDGQRLGAAIDHIVYHKDYVDMIGDKWLADVMFTTVKSKANLSGVKMSKDGDFQTGQLSRAVNNDKTNEITVNSWVSEASDRKSTLVFCVDIAHVLTLTATFRKHGIDARYITGSTKKKLRGDRLDAFKRGEFPVLLNCAVFTEGTDMPNVDCVLLARPTKSRNLLVQMIGRGMRLHPGKANCHVIDMVASLETGIVTVPTLFGLDPSEIITSSSTSDLKARQTSQIAAPSAPSSDLFSASPNTSLTFTHYTSIHDLISDTSAERHIRSLSPNAWVQIDTSKYILTTRSGILTLLHTPTTTQPPYSIIWKHPLPSTAQSKALFSRPRTIATSTTLASALNAADTFAATKFERLFILTSSSWRKQPASEAQLEFLNKLRDVREETSLTPADLKKGQAVDMITKIKFGARGRWDRMERERRGVERVEKRVEGLRRREEVRVGPLEV